MTGVRGERKVLGGVIETYAAANLEGKPFVTVSVNGSAFGQLSPAEATSMGLRFIMSAIEAERDAGFVAYYRESGFSDKKIGEELAQMREHRQHYDPPEAKA